MVQPGNPKAIHSLADLARGDVRLINRNRGSGTRLWFDWQLRQLGIAPEQIQGYVWEAFTHRQCALAVKNQKADVALGVEAAAREESLDFIPLFQERYDLTFFSEFVSDYLPLLDHLTSATFRQALRALPGYDSSESGRFQAL